MSIAPENIKQIAEAYTEAWCSRSGEKVASFFSEDATSIINKGDPTIGRATKGTSSLKLRFRQKSMKSLPA